MPCFFLFNYSFIIVIIIIGRQMLIFFKKIFLQRGIGRHMHCKQALECVKCRYMHLITSALFGWRCPQQGHFVLWAHQAERILHFKQNILLQEIGFFLTVTINKKQQAETLITLTGKQLKSHPEQGRGGKKTYESIKTSFSPLDWYLRGSEARQHSESARLLA